MAEDATNTGQPGDSRSDAGGAAAGLDALKRAQRARVRAVLEAIAAEEWAKRSARVCAAIENFEAVRRARGVMAYAPLRCEVDITPVVRTMLAGAWPPARTATTGANPGGGIDAAAGGGGHRVPRGARAVRVCVPRVNWGDGTMAAAWVTDWDRDLVFSRCRRVREPAAHCETVGGERDAGGPRARTSGGDETPGGVRTGLGGRTGEGGGGGLASEVDVILVPGVAFDRRGNRLGRGGGFYDRFLASARLPGGGGEWALRVGVAVGAQIVEHVASGEGDARMDYIVTDEGVIEARKDNHDA